MTELKCETCGAELLRAAGFCRQCGAATSTASAGESSESPTAIFPSHNSATTQRLQPRPTMRERSSPPPSTLRMKIFLLVALVVLGVGVLAAVATLSDRDSQDTPSEQALLYPEATTVLNMDHSDGGRTIHLQMSDPLDRVESWYQIV